ncbi:hypothetical protein [Acidaminococcus intestini]|nr:hypothetical protein [Acidaminococcus intestini]
MGEIKLDSQRSKEAKAQGIVVGMKTGTIPCMFGGFYEIFISLYLDI